MGDPEKPRPDSDDALETVEDVIHDDYGLGRSAYHLARIIASLTGRGEVVAVNARWGAGKTSLVNLAEKFFCEDGGVITARSELQEKFCPIGCAPETFSKEIRKWYREGKTFVRFNGWLEDGASVAEAMLDAIEDTVLATDKSKLLRRKVVRHLTRNSTTYARLVVGAINLTNLAMGNDQTEANMEAKVAANTAERVTKISKKLEDENQKLAVVIDDVDRMPPDRIQALMAALWLVRDIENIDFLILCEREQVIDALARTMFSAIGGKSGRDSAVRFLEKIVQYSFDVPHPSTDQLLDALENALERQLKLNLQARETDRFNEQEDRWVAVRRYVLRDLVTTPRAVKQLTRTVKFSLAMRGYIDIDPRDLVAIEAIRLFAPPVFALLEDLAARIELDDVVEQRWVRGKNQDNSKLAVMLPAHFRNDQGSALETMDNIEDRRGFGTPTLMSHYLQVVPNPGTATRYNLEDFFHERWARFRNTIIRAANEGEVDRLCMEIAEQIALRNEKVRNHAMLLRELQSAAEWVEAAKDFPGKQALVAKLKAQGSLVDV